MSLRRRVSLLALCAVAACSKKDAVDTAGASSAKPAAAAAPSPSASPKASAKPPAANADKKVAPSKGPATPPAGFTAKSTRKGGAPVAYRFALAYRYEGSTVLHVELSTHQRGCTDVGADERELSAGESIVDLAVAPQVGGGVAVVQVAEQTAAGTQSFVLGRRADVKVVAGDPLKDVQLVVSNGKALVDEEPVIDGTIMAWGCRVVPSPWTSSDPKPIAQPGLTLEIGGNKLAIQGAIHRVQRKEIVLSTHALSCTGEAAETDVRLTVSDSGEKVDVGGFAITGPERAEPQQTPVTVKLQDFSFGRETDDVKLAGAFTVAGHHGKVQGSARLLSCQ